MGIEWPQCPLSMAGNSCPLFTSAKYPWLYQQALRLLNERPFCLKCLKHAGCGDEVAESGTHHQLKAMGSPLKHNVNIKPA